MKTLQALTEILQDKREKGIMKRRTSRVGLLLRLDVKKKKKQKGTELL